MNRITRTLASLLITVAGFFPLALGAQSTSHSFFHHAPKMPSQVNVNGVLWQIDPMDKATLLGNPLLLGHTDCLLHRVMIRMDGDRKEILLHELSHAVVCFTDRLGSAPANLYYNSSSTEDHEGIYHFSQVWRDLLRRNPALGAYLASKD